ncbi:hypothetical protein ID866_11262 [Astraeus odoratus]|nr:hypothetical protein ID866_11262 [Astraeus odoratus]
MSQTHRQEVYDDNMRDSNWKKVIGIDSTKVARWELDVLKAEKERGEALDIYLLTMDKAPILAEVHTG